MLARARLGDGVGKWRKWDEDSIEQGENKKKKDIRDGKMWRNRRRGRWVLVENKQRGKEKKIVMIFFIVSKYYSLP